MSKKHFEKKKPFLIYMDRLLPHAFSEVKSSKSQQVPTLKRMCERFILKHSELWSSFSSVTSSPALDDLLEFFQSRFALDDSSTMAKFLCTSLSRLRLQELFIDDVFLERVSLSCPNLCSLEVWDINISVQALAKALFSLPHLSRLKLGHCVGVDEGGHQLAHVLSPNVCSQLQHLHLVCSPQMTVTNASLSNFSNFSNLSSFSLEHCPHVTSPHLQHILNTNTKNTLSRFLASKCAAVDDALLFSLAQSAAKSLRSLRIHDGEVSDKGAVAIINNCPHIEELDFSLTAISCTTLETFAKKWSDEQDSLRLRSIDLSRLYNITKSALEDFFYACSSSSSLVSVFLVDQEEADDEVLDVLCTCCPQLQVLNIAKCTSVTDTGVSQVVSECEQLRMLNLKKCPNVSQKLKLFLVNRLSSKIELIV